MTDTSLEKLQDLIGYRFREPKFLLEALTHSSFVSEAPEGSSDNEQMEFLGDAILNFLVSVRLTDTFPQIEEGKLSRGRASLVAAPNLSEVAARLGLGEYLRLGRGEEKTGGRSKSALRVNALEALVAALYRDGGLETARDFVEKFILYPGLEGGAEELFSIDYKSKLQEHLQAERSRPAEYRVVNEMGPEHEKVFTVEVSAGEKLAARGSGGSKKVAEQRAANALLKHLGRKANING
jgi:ribonuclease-3